MRTWHAAVVALCAGILMLNVGCGEKASETKPMDQVKAEAEKMDSQQLRDTAKAYLDKIKAQQSKLKEVQDKLKEIKVTELMSDKAKAIKADAAKISSSVKNLQDRMNVYLDQLKKKGEDVSY